MSTQPRTLGPQFAPAWHRPFFRYFDGEQGGGAGGGAPAAPAEQAPPAPAAAPVPTPPPAQVAAPAAPPAPPAAPIAYKGDPDEYVRELRGEAKSYREAKEAAETLAAEREQAATAAAAERDQLARENHLLRVAGKHGANADMLLDSSSFMKTFADVDLSKEDDVKKAIEDALERNSAFRAGPTLPGASGPGHQGSQRTTTPTKSLEGAVAAHFGG